MARLLACEAFTTEALIGHHCSCDLDLLVAAGIDIDDIIDAASDLVVQATFGQVTGRCSQTLRPCADTCGCGRGSDACGCCRLDAIPLPLPNPVVTQVMIDGDVLAAEEYGIMDGTHLVRLATGVRPDSWPGCQILYRPTTEDATFSITVTSGALPFVAQMAATELACDLISGFLGGNSVLPPGTIGAVMDSVSVQIDANQMNSFPWMQKLAGAYPLAPRPVVWSPEVDDGWTLHTITQ